MVTNTLLTDIKPDLKDKSGIILCTKGSAHMGYTKVYEVQKGTLFLYNSVLNHLVLDHSDDFEITYITTTKDNVRQELFAGMEEIMMHHRVKPFVNEPISDEMIEKFSERVKILEEMDHKIENDTVYYEKLFHRRIRGLRFQEYILSILLESFQFEPIPEVVKSSDALILPMKFVRLANKHYQQRNLDFFAKELNVSIGQLNRMVKNYYKKSPHDLLASVTINKAKSLLREKRLCLKEIASELAFPDQSTFQRYFKKNTGMTPREFQEKTLDE